MQNKKKLLTFNSSLPFQLGLFLILSAALASYLKSNKLSESLAIYAYFAFCTGVLTSLWELYFKESIRLTREGMLIFLGLALWIKLLVL